MKKKDMEQNNKYYTPEITELHVGYECELKLNYSGFVQEFAKYKFGYDVPKDLILIQDGITANQSDFEIRTKYLDKDDIEECGWIKESLEDKMIFTRQRGEWNYYILKFSLVQNITGENYSPLLQILIKHINGNESQLFLGKIYNKSELRKLMQQLGIV